MRRSTERILTTHTGSLPRPQDLLQMVQRRGAMHDTASTVTRAVTEIVRKQLEVGVDIVNDGEMSKPSYATYVKDRLSGFDGEAAPMALADFSDYPEYGERFMSQGVMQKLARPACTAPVTCKDTTAVQTDIANLKAALAQNNAAEAFMSAASPGVISIFLANRYYNKHEDYLAALAEAMRPEYQAITNAGIILQIDCPDLAMGRHIQFPDATPAEFRKNITVHVEALNHALEGIPPECTRMHLCWGNYEGPHHRDVPLRDIIDIVFKANVCGISYEASNPRHEHEWTVFEDVKLPDGKVLIPGVIDSVTNFIEHPELVAQRICNVARIVGRENVVAGTDCGFATVAGYSAVDAKITWAKFQSMAEGARIASRKLFH
ncbi:MAG: cobalamin-independent methionine synthase II family protein [Deltaproteobacteria bacterium]|nr:cobalamin-independent methionine synthase II family protein [Deltaproteobacteria bacterium]